MQLVLDTNGLIVKKRNNSFWIMAKEGKRLISPKRVSSIAVTADCLFSSAAIRLAANHSIPIFFMNASGHAESKLWAAAFGSTATIRRQQVLFALTPEATVWIISLFQLKLEGQVATLKYIQRTRPKWKAEMTPGIAVLQERFQNFAAHEDQLLPDVRSNIMGVEGSMGQRYWALVGKATPEPFQFSGRSRRPAQDPFNAGLNYMYGMLYNLVSSACLAAGLDPYLGFLHTDGYKRPSLTFDMIEPFRPWVDQIWLEQFYKKRVKQEFFTKNDNGLRLNAKGKRFIIPLFNDYMAASIVYRKRKLSRKNHIYRFAGKFAQFLLKKEETDDPFDFL